MLRALSVALGVAWVALVALGMSQTGTVRMGRQPDGSFLVSSGQRIEGDGLAFRGRPIELALHPSGEFFAVLSKAGVYLGSAKSVDGSNPTPLGNSNPGFRGLVWTPDGKTLVASTDKGHLQTFTWDGSKLLHARAVAIQPPGTKGNPVPGGMTFAKDGRTLFVAAANLGAVIELDLPTGEIKRSFQAQQVPFTVAISDDERTLVVSNWGGRTPETGDTTSKSQNLQLVVDERNATASGTVSLIDRASGVARHVEVGIHPTDVLVAGAKAYIACAMSDHIAELDITTGNVIRTIPMSFDGRKILGAMPNALALRGETLYVANGGDNALAEIDLNSGTVRGYRHAGYFPTAVSLSQDGKHAFVLNTKGNGSVANTMLGRPGNAHDFQGTVTVVDLDKELAFETKLVASNNRWNHESTKPRLPVYQGAIEHVIYIIKENRTYDEVFGDMPEGNGDPRLCSLGETVMPNHRKLAREFTLFDNGYVSGTNSADGHAWSTQAIANEYLEHFYVGYSRSYPDDGEDALAISKAGALWDAALDKGRTVRVYGEFCDNDLARIEPQPKTWFEVWEDRKAGGNKFQFFAATHLRRLRPLIHPNYLYWPLWQSDQQRADMFIKEYEQFAKDDRVPNLMVLSLPCDHGEGTNPAYPTPRAMMADNDLALGRIVEAVSKSPQWKSTCIFVIEDDAQSGPDHVDGHRTVFMAISPYTKRRFVDSEFYTTTHMLRSIELMLGLDAMNRFDALSYPMTACFQNEPVLTPYTAAPNRVPLDERNPSPSDRRTTALDRYWYERTMALDWRNIDAADPYWLNRINWYSVFKGARPYPDRPGDAPGQFEEEEEEDGEEER
jgi:DNA-binding beta-propeller fold protein YncE